MDFKSLFDFTKLPTKIYVAIFLLSSVLIFSPKSIQDYLSIGEIVLKYRGYISLCMLASTCLIGTNFTIWLFQKSNEYSQRRKIKKSIINNLRDLDNAEKAILREFFLQAKNVIELPIDHPTVSGLMHKHIICVVGTQGYHGLAGSVFPLKRTKTCIDYLSLDHIDLPNLEHVTPEQVTELRNLRPNFITEILRHDHERRGLY